MLLFIMAINKDVIKVDDDKLSNEVLEDLVHNMHEGAGSVRETKWHY